MSRSMFAGEHVQEMEGVKLAYADSYTVRCVSMQPHAPPPEEGGGEGGGGGVTQPAVEACYSYTHI
jgi:hypothetical protein